MPFTLFGRANPQEQSQPSEQRTQTAADGQNNTVSTPYYVIFPHQVNIYDNDTIAMVALSRSMQCLAMVDLILLTILSFFNIFYLFGLWGPLCGYFGAKKYNPCLVYVWAGYWILHFLSDLILLLNGYWLFVISIGIDLYIFWYVSAFARALSALSPDELNQLRNPLTKDVVVVSNV